MNKFFLITSVLLIFPVFVLAYGAGMGSCCLDITFDKQEYNPGDKVIITIQGNGNLDHFDESVSVKISDVTNGPDYSKVVFSEQKKLEDGKIEFEFKSPSSSDKYRYLLTLESVAGVTEKMFFTKPGASKIVISDIDLITPTVKQGESLKINAKIVDGVGKPSHYLRITANSDIPEYSCPNNFSPFSSESSPLYSIQPDYWSKGIININIPVSPTAKPGIYDLIIGASGDFEGYTFTQTKVKFEILETEPNGPAYSVFAPFDFKFKPGFMTEQVIDFTALTAYNGCGAPIPNVPVKAEIRKYDIHSLEYETLASQELVSDENGLFHVHFEPIGLQAGYFSLVFSSTYPGVEGYFGIESPHNTKDFTITAEGKDFVIETDTWYSIPQTIEFDQTAKKLTLDVDTSDTYRRIALKVPTELLDGDLLVYENGFERGDTFSKQPGYTQFDFHTNSDHSHIEIIGTTAIPEFGFIVTMILLVSLVPVIVYSRLKVKL